MSRALPADAFGFRRQVPAARDTGATHFSGWSSKATATAATRLSVIVTAAVRSSALNVLNVPVKFFF